MQSVAERLADCSDLEEVVKAVIQETMQTLGASAVTIGTVDAAGRNLVLLSSAGLSARTQELISEPVPLEAHIPASEVVSSRRPVFWSDLVERDRAYPSYTGYRSGHASWAILPLVVHGRAIGILALGWSDPRKFAKPERALLTLIAQQSAIAVDRALIQEQEKGERATLELLSEGTRLMISALEPERVLRRLVRLAVPALAPWCAVYVAEKGRLRRVAIEVQGHPDLAEEPGAEATVDVAPDPVGGDPVGGDFVRAGVGASQPLAEAYRTGETIVVRGLSAPIIRTIHDERQAARPQGGGGPFAAMVVPVKISGRTVGVMSLLSDRWGAVPPEGLRFAAEGLAARAGVALGNARRFEQERLTASLLTQALVPAEMPAIPGYDTASSYLPSGASVAGDWFDLVRTPSGAYLIGIGDAAGHGIPAASLMAQLRNAARGLAFGGGSPPEIVNGLSLLTAEDDADSFATALYGLLDTTAATLRWSTAGHIPPLLYSPAGARFLEVSKQPPLGLPASEPAAEWTVTLEPGGGLVFVTDGVVERRRTDLALGMHKLRRLVLRHRRRDAASIVAAVVRELCGHREDDCSVMVVRRLPEQP